MKIGFVSDIHEDINNLQNAFRTLEEKKCDQIICLGDIVGFAIPFYKNITERDAESCVKLIRENCQHTVVGNHDLFAIRKVPTNKAGFNYKENWYQLEYEKRASLSRKKIWLYEDNEIPCVLSDKSQEFLYDLEEYQTLEIKQKKIFISHFCYPDFTGSHIHFPSEAFHLRNHFQFITKLGCNISFSGHGHPEGALVTNCDKISNRGFGKYSLLDESLWIVAPAVARTSRKNGVMIIDIDLMELQIIPLTY
ncbi:MAG TPA: metallophosphoesterase family protein [Ignavibacteriaceae bacterium]|nr:metallophosphoesterase family protein [Ignavibacteriaceae bacterium]